MCEWLSREAWCDVRLLCGGRAFGAHRAVLASVSSFLRRLLLSCPIEETPTMIVLPDFDLEAMSAVLYYIYNGEVTMPKQKLEKFLDIIKAMQIFIDRQYLTHLSLSSGEIDFNISKYATGDDHIFILREENDDKSLVNFKKLFQQDNSQCFSKDEADYSEIAQSSRQTWNEQIRPSLGDLHSWHGDRQRDNFLRDSFMETYPRNRSANGRAAGVPAIPNGSYRGPASLLLTNANANGYLSSDDALLSTTEKTVSPYGKTAPYNVTPRNHLYKAPPENLILADLRRKLSTETLNDVWMRHQPVLKAAPVDILQRSYDSKRTTYLDLRMIQKSSETLSYSSIPNNNITPDKLPFICHLENNTKTKIVKPNAINTRDASQNRVAILNKALDNPWCPRLPNSFRPFRRKNNSSSVNNDNNNNIQVNPALSVKDECSRESSDFCNSVNFATASTCDDKEYANDQALPTSELGGRSRYSCSECGKTFSQLRNFKYHMSVHRGTKEFAASCTVCGKCFNDRGYLSSHMKIHRNRKEYKCSLCPKSFNQRVAYNMHVRIHTGVKPHVCPQCGKAFSRKMLLKQHQRTHSGERPYACPHCDKRFADRSNMTLHLRLHTGIKPFKCPICPKSFTKKHHLKSHVNFHTGAKPYSCPRCNLAFTQSSNMRTHLKRCTATAPEQAIVDVKNT